MKMASGFMLATLIYGLPAVAVKTARRNRGHPVEDVIELMKRLSVQAEEQGKQEAVTYTKFEKWCADSEKTLEAAITKGEEQSEILSAKISSYDEEVAVLQEQITALGDELMRLDTAAQQAQSARTAENALYQTAESDYTSTIEAIDQAITALKTAATDTSSLLLVKKALTLSGSVASEEQRHQMEAFVQLAQPERPEFEASGDHAGHVKKYAFKSNNVIELLKELKRKFEDDRLAANKAETNAVNAFDLAKAARDTLQGRASDAKLEKETRLGTTQGELNQTKAELLQTQTDLSADKGTLTQTEKACAIKKSEWVERSETREKEIEAMKAAIAILAKVTGVRTEAPSNPVPPASPVDAPPPASLLQLAVDPKQRAVQILRASAHETHSHAMEMLAEEVSAHLTGPFDAINNMIQKMIFHLMNEQKEEDVHKNWCDLELNKTEISKENKENKMQELDIKIEEAQAMVQTLTLDIQAANEFADTVAAHVEEATKIRNLGKEENRLAAKDAQDAQEALANAIAVLEAFYKSSGAVEKQSWEFVQRGVTLPSSPSTWEAGYTGVADPASQPEGIIVVLKQVSSDFSRMEAETMAQESSDQEMFEQDMKLCAIEKARRLKEADMKAAEKSRQVNKIAEMQSSHKHVSNEHEAVEQYLADLQHACVDGDSTYDDRKAARAKEITALKDAQGILTNAFEEPNEPVVTPSPPGLSSASFLQRRW